MSLFIACGVCEIMSLNINLKDLNVAGVLTLVQNCEIIVPVRCHFGRDNDRINQGKREKRVVSLVGSR